MSNRGWFVVSLVGGAIAGVAAVLSFVHFGGCP